MSQWFLVILKLLFIPQHDVSKTKLQTALDGVVEQCVSFTGVDLNTASQCLLRSVCPHLHMVMTYVWGRSWRVCLEVTLLGIGSGSTTMVNVLDCRSQLWAWTRWVNVVRPCSSHSCVQTENTQVRIFDIQDGGRDNSMLLVFDKANKPLWCMTLKIWRVLLYLVCYGIRQSSWQSLKSNLSVFRSMNSAVFSCWV